MAIVCVVGVSGCGNKDTASNAEPEISDSSLDLSKDSEAEPDHADNMASGDMIPSVMVDGKVYQDTGYISSAIGCGNMDGEITSTVDGSEMPSKDDQSNFGKGYSYQYGGENTVLVQMNDQMEIFRDIDSNDDSIPMEVACFIGKVKEIRDDSLIIAYVQMPDSSPCRPLNDGDYVVSRENADSDINTCDTVKVWYSGSIEETDPAQLDAYKIVKDTSE